MMTRLFSRPIEKVAPTASRLSPSSSASGRPSTRVPKACPSSWKHSAQPAWRSCGNAWPAISPSLTMNNSRALSSRRVAYCCGEASMRSQAGNRRAWLPRLTAASRAISIGSSATRARPRSSQSGPIHSAAATLASTASVSRSRSRQAGASRVAGASAAGEDKAILAWGGCGAVSGRSGAATMTCIPPMRCVPGNAGAPQKPIPGVARMSLTIRPTSSVAAGESIRPCLETICIRPWCRMGFRIGRATSSVPSTASAGRVLRA